MKKNKIKNNDLYIEILEYGSQKKDGFTLNQLKKDLNLSEKEIKALSSEVIIDDIFISLDIKPNDPGNTIYRLSFESKFRLLEYVELEEARRSSRNSMRMAIFAILISVFVGGYQVFTPQKVIVIEKNIIPVNQTISGTFSAEDFVKYKNRKIIEKISSATGLTVAMILVIINFFPWYTTLFDGDPKVKKWGKLVLSIAFLLLLTAFLILFI